MLTKPSATENLSFGVKTLRTENVFDRQTFEYLAAAAGLSIEDPHMDELFPYVQAALAANGRLQEIDTAGFEPDTSFDPAQFYQA